MAPEIVEKKEYCGDKADMWACGVVMYTMLTGNFPFKGNDQKGLFRHIQKGSFIEPSISSNARDLIH